MTGTKLIEQNLFDFVVTHYGSLEYLNQFFIDNDISDILYFSNQAVGTKFNITQTPNRVIKTYDKAKYQIATNKS